MQDLTPFGGDIPVAKDSALPGLAGDLVDVSLHDKKKNAL